MRIYNNIFHNHYQAYSTNDLKNRAQLIHMENRSTQAHTNPIALK